MSQSNSMNSNGQLPYEAQCLPAESEEGTIENQNTFGDKATKFIYDKSTEYLLDDALKETGKALEKMWVQL